MAVRAGELPQQIACTTCGYTNPGFQKFCGMCGAALNPESQVESAGDRRNPAQSPSHGPGYKVREQREESPYRAEASAPVHTQNRGFGDRDYGLRLSEPAPAPPIYGDSRADNNDLDWLRSRDVLGTDIMESEPSRVWKV